MFLSGAVLYLKLNMFWAAQNSKIYGCSKSKYFKSKILGCTFDGEAPIKIAVLCSFESKVKSASIGLVINEKCWTWCRGE